MSSVIKGNRNRYRFLLCFLIPLLSVNSACHVVRYAWWNYADIGDGTRFPSVRIAKPAVAKPIATGSFLGEVALPASYRSAEAPDLSSFLESRHTVAFLVIKNDTLICEQYFGGYSRESAFPSFSVAKSFISALTGIAIEEGKIQSVDQPVTDFLPGMAAKGFSAVTIRDLLEMRSGVDFREEYGSPFAKMSKFYYGLDLRKYTLDLEVERTPGQHYEYQSANTELLALVLEQATGRTVPEYFGEKIWTPMGSEYEATWNTDSRKHMQVKAFCCLNARALDFAKFGQLYLHDGMAGSDTVVPSSWVRETRRITNDSRDSQGLPYTFHWRVTDDGDFFAKGILGQYIYVCPSRKVVIVRLGKKSTDFRWAAFFRQLALDL